MPQTPEEKAAYKRLHRINNREEVLKKEKIYRDKNKDKNKVNQLKFLKTDKGKKYKITKRWKEIGLISDNYDKIYEIYLNTEECDNCGIELNQDGATKKCMDHDHSNGFFRNILCKSCNNKRG